MKRTISLVLVLVLSMGWEVANADFTFGTPTNLGPTVNSSSVDWMPSISADGLTLYFGSRRSGGFGSEDIWATVRATTGDPWEEPVNIGPPVNSSAVYDQTPNISADGSTLYFTTERPGDVGSGDIYQALIIPIVDFNGDGIVDATDICIMVDHWGTDYSLCDIGPMPWGDGVVDVEDLKVLAENLFEEVSDPTLIAQWALDETEGMVVADSAGDNNGYALGDPVWRPDGGQVNGAFEGVSGLVEKHPAKTRLTPKAFQET